MWTSLRIASLGVLAQQRALDVASNNIANLNTLGFKKQRADLADVPPTDETFGLGTEPGPLVLGQAADGGGAVMVGMLTDLEPGPATVTHQPLDFMIDGAGFVAVTTPSGQTAFTRSGAMHRDGDGRLVIGNGNVVTPELTIPPDALSIGLSADGSIGVTRPGGVKENVGRLSLTRFANPEGLVRMGDGLYAADPQAGATTSAFPGVDGIGSLVPGALEGSNVDLGEEMVRVIQAQRAYQMNLRSLKTVDEMLQAANNLQR
jgi:flagellar basal-body rod protein FlgG